MPGPVSDSFDPEWGTSAVAEEIDNALAGVYERLCKILDDKPPMYIVDLVRAPLGTTRKGAALTEKEWRLLRFAVERARSSL